MRRALAWAALPFALLLAIVALAACDVRQAWINTRSTVPRDERPDPWPM